jgi:uncharacterized protein YjbI with pentapeptide repeats
MANPEQLVILRQGVNAWNQWRRDNPDVAIDLSGANLSHANLCGSNLSFTDLCILQGLATNFEKTNLTDACIEDWHINSQTNLEGVICNFIYQQTEWRGEKKIYLDRLPHDPDRNFEPGEFTRLF